MDRVIIIDDAEIGSALEDFLLSHRKQVKLSSSLQELLFSNNPLVKEVVKRYEEKLKIKIQSKDAVQFLKCNEIIRISGEDRVTAIQLSGGRTVAVEVSLPEVWTQLAGLPFVRIRPDLVINLHYLDRINPGDRFLRLCDGSSFSIEGITEPGILDLLTNYCNP